MYKVLIKCCTYNQEQYIEDALKGFVRQKTDFPFCALVIDDHSTDRTAEIVRRYEAQYPDIIKGLYLPYNMYGKPEKEEYIKPWEEQAQYIAYCEGDDYWIDDNKLQRQVDFLDSHPEYTLCFHNALVKSQGHTSPDRLLCNFPTGDIDTVFLFKNGLIPLASVIFRSEMLRSEAYRELKTIGGWGFVLLLTACKTGKVYGLSECLSVYRVNEGGVSNRMSNAFCLQIAWRLAEASQESEAKRIVKDQIIRELSSVVPLLFTGDSRGKEMLEVARAAGKGLVARALVRFVFLLPKKVLKKL